MLVKSDYGRKIFFVGGRLDMRAAEFTLSGDCVREILLDKADRYDVPLEELAKWMLLNREQARKKFYLPVGTEFLDIHADVWNDQLQVSVSHPDLPLVPHGVKLPYIIPIWRRRGQVVAFVTWGIEK